MITSTQNDRIKHISLLIEKSKERQRTSTFVIEGFKEITLALGSSYDIVEVFYCPDMFTDLSVFHSSTLCTPISKRVFEKLAYRKGSDGIIAISKMKQHSITSFSPSTIPFFVTLESVEKPGNIGAIARTVDAVGASALVLCDPLCDIYNPNVIRSSVGTIFTINVIVCSSIDFMHYCTANAVNIYTASLQDSVPYYQSNFLSATALIFGTEHSGVSDIWRTGSHSNIIIPMLGHNDSLNVSVSVGILAYEVLRQRTFHTTN